MTNAGAKNLMAAVMLQAVKDWEYLCKQVADGRVIRMGSSYTDLETRERDRTYNRLQYSFEEIEKFIVNYGEICVEMDLNIILTKLRKERQKAVSQAARHHDYR